jgi:ERCC4-type nuclease
MKVFIDSREQSRIKQASEYYAKQGLTVEVKELEIGDYLFSNGEDSVCFEFKTIADFISSIQDNRVFNEALNQAENYNHHFVVIQGDESTRAKCLAFTKNYRPVTIFQYHGAIASLNRYTTVLESYSSFIDEAFYKMLVQTRKCLSDKPIVRKFPKKTSNSAFNFLCGCVYGVNYKKANTIVNTYHLESLADLMKLTEEDLMEIDGIGKETANKILEAIQ